jgi:alkanesulfonate monooxygenase SsuD/methylene tetrahydromethanopterin reductase-like flavin-dependent oxidoreductase (luciferase family)
MTSVEFGLGLSTSAAPENDPVAMAVSAEALGFDFVSASDHPCGDHPTYETPTLLTWIAARTSRIRIASRVLGMPYRQPPMVAKMAESLSRLSDGRLILGLGGGYSDAEFRAFGLGVPTPGQKVQGFEEGIAIIRGLWTQERLTFHGSRYQTDDAQIEPKPDQRIPIWLGTLGDRALAVTGRLADGWIPSIGHAPPQRATLMRDRVLAAAKQAGRQPQEITCAYHMEIRVGDGNGLGPDVVSGQAAAVAERLAGFVRLGFTALSLTPAGPDPAQQAHLLAAEVIPAVRAAL